MLAVFRLPTVDSDVLVWLNCPERDSELLAVRNLHILAICGFLISSIILNPGGFRLDAFKYTEQWDLRDGRSGYAEAREQHQNC